MAAPRPRYNTEELEQKIQEYFDSLEKDGKKRPPTVSGLAYHLGFESRQSIYDYRKREKEPASSYLMKKTLLYIESYYETMLNRAQNVGGIIFWLKNHNWSDKQELVHSGAVTIIDDIK